MQSAQILTEYEVYGNARELDAADKMLLDKAKDALKTAYAPYSNFKVGAAARLVNENIIAATNQENASFPAGICAERNLLAVASSLYPSVAVETIAISYKNENGESDHPISPCGICRQSLFEYEERMQHSIRLVLGGMSGKVYILNSAKALMPLSFSTQDMK